MGGPEDGSDVRAGEPGSGGLAVPSYGFYPNVGSKAVVESPWQQRVVEEKAQLDDRLEKLTAFAKTDTFAQLPVAEQDRLTKQHNIMTSYSLVLEERIQNFAKS